MSSHSNQPDTNAIDPAFEALLRRAATLHDLAPQQNRRLRARLGFDTATGTVTPTASAATPLTTTPTRRTGNTPPAAIPRSRSARRQWLDIALGSAALVLVALALAAIFRGIGDDEPQSPGVSASPEATATAEAPAATATTAVALPAKEYANANFWPTGISSPGGIAVAANGQIYIVDSERDVVQVFTPTGVEVGSIAFTASAGGPPGNIDDIAIGPDGSIFVLDTRTLARVLRYAPDGSLIAEWGGTLWQEPGSVFSAWSIAVDDDGFVYVADGQSRLQKFTGDGELIDSWDRAGEYLFPSNARQMQIHDGSLYVLGSGYRMPDNLTVILRFDLDGNLNAEPLVFDVEGDGIDFRPATLAVGPDGNLFVASAVTREVAVLTLEGEAITRWTLLGSLESQPERFPLTVAPDGTVYVAHSIRQLVQVFVPVDSITSTAIPLPPDVSSVPSSGVRVQLFANGEPPKITRAEAMQAVAAEFPWGLGGDWEGQQVTVDSWHGLATIEGFADTEIVDRAMWILDYGNVPGIIGSGCPDCPPPPVYNHNVYAVDTETLELLFLGSYADERAPIEEPSQTATPALPVDTAPLDRPDLDVTVYWLGERFEPGASLPPLVLAETRGPGGPPFSRAEMQYGSVSPAGGVTLRLLPRTDWDTWTAADPSTDDSARVFHMFWDSPCAEQTEVEIAGGQAVIYSSYQALADYSVTECPNGPFDRFIAHAFLGDTVVTVNAPFMLEASSGPDSPDSQAPYNSVEGMRAVLEGLHVRERVVYPTPDPAPAADLDNPRSLVLQPADLPGRYGYGNDGCSPYYNLCATRPTAFSSEGDGYDELVRAFGRFLTYSYEYEHFGFSGDAVPDPTIEPPVIDSAVYICVDACDPVAGLEQSAALLRYNGHQEVTGVDATVELGDEARVLRTVTLVRGQVDEGYAVVWRHGSVVAMVVVGGSGAAGLDIAIELAQRQQDRIALAVAEAGLETQVVTESGAWTLTVIEHEGQSGAGVSYGGEAEADIVAYAEAVRALGPRAFANHETVPVLITFRQPVSFEYANELLADAGAQALSYRLRTLPPDGGRGTMGSPASPDGTLVPPIGWNPRIVGAEGVFDIEAVIDREAWELLSNDPFIFLVDVMRTIAFDELMEHGITNIPMDTIGINGPFWLMEEHGMVPPEG